VRLTAPQYPEGLGMHIRLHTVTGVTPTDLENINGLNHYIGMARIEPDAIPELRFMPWLVGGFIVAGLGAAALGRRWGLRTWTVALAATCVAGLADYWKWGYDYGHHLDLENAPIQIPGMAYQPPLIGTKVLLNFTATSLPGSGGLLLMAALGTGVVAVLLDRRARRTPPGAVDAPTAVPRRTDRAAAPMESVPV
jgi:hypothetical protein